MKQFALASIAALFSVALAHDDPDAIEYARCDFQMVDQRSDIKPMLVVDNEDIGCPDDYLNYQFALENGVPNRTYAIAFYKGTLNSTYNFDQCRFRGLS